MSLIRVTKEYNFEMAHALWNYDGLCKNVHGHSYKLFVTVIGKPIDDVNNPKYGMVIDFGDLKKIINQKIIQRFDHAVVVSKHAPYQKLKEIEQMFHRLDIVDFQPTCENLVIECARLINEELPAEVSLYSLRLYETANSYAEWFASDNK